MFLPAVSTIQLAKFGDLDGSDQQRPIICQSISLSCLNLTDFPSARPCLSDHCVPRGQSVFITLQSTAGGVCSGAGNGQSSNTLRDTSAADFITLSSEAVSCSVKAALNMSPGHPTATVTAVLAAFVARVVFKPCTEPGQGHAPSTVATDVGKTFTSR